MLANHVILYPLLSPIPSPPLQRYPPLLLPFSPTPLSPIFSPPLHSPPPPSFALSATRTKSRPVSAHPSKGLKHKERGREGEKEADARPCGALPHSLKTLAPVFKGPQTPRCSPRSLIPPARSLFHTLLVFTLSFLSLFLSLCIYTRIYSHFLLARSLSSARSRAPSTYMFVQGGRDKGIQGQARKQVAGTHAHGWQQLRVSAGMRTRTPHSEGGSRAHCRPTGKRSDPNSKRS